MKFKYKLFSQEGSILPGQKSAIASLATSAGFSTEISSSKLWRWINRFTEKK